MGLWTALHLWDLSWPPSSFERDASQWSQRSWLLRAHVPDLSDVDVGAERRLECDLRTAAAGGAVAVKVWKNLGLHLRDARGRRLAIDDSRLATLWTTAAELGLPVIVHQGDPPAFFEPLDECNPRWAELRARPDMWLGGGGFPSLEQLHEEFEAVVAEHRDTTFVGAHFGSFMPHRGPHDRWDLREFFACHFRFFESGEPGLSHPLAFQGDWTVRGLSLPPAVCASSTGRTPRGCSGCRLPCLPTRRRRPRRAA